MKETGFAEAPSTGYFRREKMKTQPNSYCAHMIVAFVCAAPVISVVLF